MTVTKVTINPITIVRKGQKERMQSLELHMQRATEYIKNDLIVIVLCYLMKRYAETYMYYTLVI